MSRFDRLKRLFTALLLLSWLAVPLASFGAEGAASPEPVSLTPAEKAWLAKHPVIRIAPDPSFAPIEFVDASGEYRGIAADVLAMFGSRLGIRFTAIPAASWEEALQKARDREADILGRAAPTPEREQYMSFVQGYLELPGSIIARTTTTDIAGLDDLKGRKVAVVSGYLWQKLITADYPDIVLAPTASLEEALAKVSKGTADALIANPVSATYYMRRNGIKDLALTGETGYRARYAIAVRKDWPQLQGILEKTRYSITADDVQKILDRWLDDASATITPAGVSVEVGAVSPELVAARIAELESDQGLDEKTRGKTLEYYHLTKRRLEGAIAATGQAATYKRLARTAAGDAQRLREERRAIPTTDSPGVADNLDFSLQDLEQRLAKQQAGVRTLRSSLAELVDQIALEQARPEKIRGELRVENERLSETAKELDTPTPADEHKVVTEARVTAIKARRQAHAATVRQLEQELLSHGARLNLLRARREFNIARVTLAETRFTKLQELANQRRATEAALVRQAMEQARRQATDKHPAVRRIAVENARLSAQLSSLVAQIKDVTREKELVNHDLKEMEQAYQYAREQLEIAGLSEVLGEALRAQREMLPDMQRYQTTAAERDRQLGEARLSQLRVDQRRRSLRNIAAKISQVLGTLETSLTGEEREAVASQLHTLLRDQGDLLNKLWPSYGQHVEELQHLRLAEKQLLATAEGYGALLDKELLWLASTQPIGPKWLSDLGQSLLWLISPGNWQEVGRALLAGIVGHSLSAAIALALFGVLMAGRPGLRRRADSIAANVGGLANDSYLLTVQALGVALLYVSPWPVLLYATAWLVGLSNPPAFATGVAAGLQEVALSLLLLSFFRRVCRVDGIAQTHFQWSERVRAPLWHNLGWAMAVLLPLLFIITLTESQPNELHRDALGRMAFVSLSVAQVIFAWRILHPQHGVLATPASGDRKASQRLRKYLVLMLGMALPLVFGVLAVNGFYYTAVSLEDDVFESLLVVGGGVLVYSLFERWLVVAQRRLTRARVRAGRKAMEAARRAGHSGPDAATDVPNILEVNLVSMNDQTRRLVGLFIGALVLVGLWLVWADLLPAFAILDEVTLWHARVVDGGVEGLAPVTLGSLGLAVVVVVLTFMAGRNLPGLLEMGLLESFRVKPGTLYAISTLSRYAIITIGIMTSFRLVGIGWAQVQWLAAAVGVGLGFGLREIFASFIAGLIILFERPVRVGDIVTLGTISGTVTQIRIRATTITDWDNKETVVPNNILISQELTNWTLSNEVVRVVVKVGIAHGSDTDLAERVMLEIAQKNPLVLAEPAPSVLFLGFGEHTLDFDVRAFTRDPEQRLTLIHQLHMALERGLREKGIEIALPKLDVCVRDDAGTSEPRTDRQRVFGTS